MAVGTGGVGFLATENDPSPLLIPLQPMMQQVDLRAPEDDWTGVTRASERRKIQNRLHQRAYSKFVAVLWRPHHLLPSTCRFGEILGDVAK